MATHKTNTAETHYVGVYNGGGGSFFKGYMAQVCLFDGLTITDPATDGLGEFDTNGVWRPVSNAAMIAIADTQGGNSFVLDFSDGSNLGIDVGGSYSLGTVTATMTGYTTPSGTVTADVDDGSEAWRAFNSDVSSAGAYWYATGAITTHWISYEFASAQTIKAYDLYCQNYGTIRAPKTWEFQGWNGSGWDTLDSQTGVTAWTPLVPNRYVIASPASYAKYRLYVTDWNNLCVLQEIILYGEGSYGLNHWTVNGTITQVGDTPTANGHTWNPLLAGLVGVLSNGNKTHGATGLDKFGYGTIQLPTSGKYYIEMGFTDTVANYVDWGICRKPYTASSGVGPGTYYAYIEPYMCYGFNGYTYDPAGNTAAYGNNTHWSSGTKIFQIFIDCDAGDIWFGVDNSIKGGTPGDPPDGTNVAFTGIDMSEGWVVFHVDSGGADNPMIYAEEDWTYSAPAGFVALTTDNLPAVTITDPSQHFSVDLWSGTGATQTITPSCGTGLTWIKSRSNATDHCAFRRKAATDSDPKRPLIPI